MGEISEVDVLTSSPELIEDVRKASDDILCPRTAVRLLLGFLTHIHTDSFIAFSLSTHWSENNYVTGAIRT